MSDTARAPADTYTPVDTYTHGHQEAVVNSHRKRTAANSVGYLLPYLKPGMSLLDLGCESGTITKDFANLVSPNGTVTGIDIDQAMIAKAQEEFGAIPHLNFTTGDIYHLDYADGTFDVAHAHQVLQHLSDPVAALEEMSRVVKPGGVIAARDADYASMTWFPRVPELAEWLNLYRKTAHANDAEPDAGPRLLAWAHAAGLADVKATSTSWSYAGAEAKNWGETWARRCTESSFGKQAIEKGFATQADLERIAAGWLRWTENPDAWFGMIHGEIIATIATQ